MYIACASCCGTKHSSMLPTRYSEVIGAIRANDIDGLRRLAKVGVLAEYLGLEDVHEAV
jgi:hypothetical protein